MKDWHAVRDGANNIRIGSFNVLKNRQFGTTSGVPPRDGVPFPRPEYGLFWIRNGFGRPSEWMDGRYEEREKRMVSKVLE
jgi:hypothetical protein